MLSFLGIHFRNPDKAVYSGSVIDLLQRVGVSEDATRSTLTRMVKRNLLYRHRRGRKMYFSITERAAQVLEDGYRRIWETGAVNRDWTGDWTVVTFSMPNDWRSERHDLRSELTWKGFGLLQHAVWIAPGDIEVADFVGRLGLTQYVTVMIARAKEPTESAHMVRKAFDIQEIAGRYHEFLQRWDTEQPLPECPDDLARQLLLHTDWLQLVRQDPHLPAQHLPAEWPAIRAEKLFRSLAIRYGRATRRLADEVLDQIRLAG